MNLEGPISTLEASKKLGVSVRVVRYLCDGGYIPHIRRNRNYQRVLTPEQFELLSILVKMRQFGFSKSEIKHYAKLARQEESTLNERLAILTTKKHQLRNAIKELQAAIDFIELQEESTNSSYSS